MVSIAQERDRLADVGLSMRWREQWGARFDYTTDRPCDVPASVLFLHITVTDPSRYANNDEHARAVENIGIQRFPATGISYNALILPGGSLYEGQPWSRRGAHTVNDRQWATCRTTGCPGIGRPLTAPSWNLNVVGRAVALARDLDDAVTDADVDSAAQWAAGYMHAGLATRDPNIWHGHRCAAAKDCPGGKGWARLDDIADLTADYLRTGLPGAPGDDMPTPADLWLHQLRIPPEFKRPGDPESTTAEDQVAYTNRAVWMLHDRLDRIEKALGITADSDTPTP